MTKSPQFKFARYCRRSKTSRHADALLEAVVKAIRDKKSHRQLQALVRPYPVVMNGSVNPYAVLFAEIERLRRQLHAAHELADHFAKN